VLVGGRGEAGTNELTPGDHDPLVDCVHQVWLGLGHVRVAPRLGEGS
jgi:hypothetical protein